jgi:Skp family chaperone for outer membrane proteins
MLKKICQKLALMGLVFGFGISAAGAHWMPLSLESYEERYKALKEDFEKEANKEAKDMKGICNNVAELKKAIEEKITTIKEECDNLKLDIEKYKKEGKAHDANEYESKLKDKQDALNKKEETLKKVDELHKEHCK